MENQVFYLPDFKDTIKDINMLISYAIGSLKIKSIRIEERDDLKSIRPSLHILLRAPTGLFKSTIMDNIKKVTSSIEADSITVPGLVGTADKGILVPGFAWAGRNKLLLFDEFNLQKGRENLIAFLKLLEDQFYSKKFGRPIHESTHEDGNLYLKAEHGSIEIKTRFSAVIGTMKRLEAFRDPFKAFLNRTIPYSYSFNLDEIDWIIERTELFRPIDFFPKEEIIVEWEKYEKIKERAKDYFMESNYPDYIKDENFARAVNDLVRIYCITGKINDEIIEKISYYKLDAYSKVGLYYKKKTK